MTSVSKVWDLELETITTLLGQQSFFNGFFLGMTTNIGSLVPAADAVKARDIFTRSPPDVLAPTFIAPFCRKYDLLNQNNQILENMCGSK